MSENAGVRAEPEIFVISGPMAAGKTTVAGLLARRFERGVHLEGDIFRRSIVAGRAEVTPDAPAEAMRQLDLRYRLAARAADVYAEAGFTVVVEDVIGPDLLGTFRTSIRARPCHVFVLLPDVAAITAREAGRASTGYGAWDVERLHGLFAAGPRVGHWIDTTHQSPAEVVDTILSTTRSVRSSIVVTDYDPAWPAAFEQFAAPLRMAIAPLGGQVEHVGSTSVPGLPAKPIIDIDVVVPDPGCVAEAITRLCDLGYTYQGDKGIAGREAFLWPAGATPHHVYVVVAGNKPHNDHVRFRDHLRAHPEVARAYGDLKRELAVRYERDGLGYTDAKTDFILEAMRSAADSCGAESG